MSFDVITSKIVPPCLNVIKTIAVGIICIDALVLLFLSYH